MTKKTEVPKTARQKLVDRVCKLLALAEGTNHTPEAEAAKRKAAELMAKENITTAEAMKKEDAFTHIARPQRTKEPQKFDRHPLNVIAKFNGCSFVYRTGGPKAVFILCGREPDIEATEYMYAIVCQQRKAAYDKYSERYIELYGKDVWEKDETDWRRWMNGYSSGVSAKLDELHAMTEQKLQEWGLVLYDTRKAALDWYNGHVEETRIVKGGKGAGASRAGYEAGKSVSIHKGLEGGTGDTKLIG